MKQSKSGRDRSARIGLFGGTFNPIHRGHIQVALDVLQAFTLTRVYFVPSAQPPHKSTARLASAEDRLQMVRLALAGQQRLQVCPLEIERPGPSYSVDTVSHFKATADRGTQLFFILGVDAFLEIHTWKDFARLFELTAMVVMSRPGTGQWSPELHRRVENYVQRHIAPEYGIVSGGERMIHPHLREIYFAAVTPMDMASSQIRDIIYAGASIEGRVPPAVEEYIRQKRLYHGE